MARRGPIRSYQDLLAWQKAINLLVAVNRVARRLPVPERYDYGRQMQRAAFSIPSNIAEGFGRDHLGDFLRHLSVARGSVRELEAQLLAIQALLLVPASDLAPLLSLADEISRMLAVLSRKLRSRADSRLRKATQRP